MFGAYPGGMNAVDTLIDLARRPLEAAERLRGSLTPARVNAHPHHDNSVAWLLWHAARQLDEQLSALSGGEPVWTRDGFDRRFALDLAPHEIGYGHAPEQARRIRVDEPDLLLEHLAAVVSAQVAYLEGLEDAALEQVIDEQWDPPVTRGARLVSMSVDAAEHVGQAAYVLGMGEDAFERER